MFSGLPEFDINDLTGFNNSGDLALDGFNWENPSKVAGPSQPYTGADVQGDLNNYPEFPSPRNAPTSLYPARGTIANNEGYNPSFYQGVAGSSSSQAATTLPHFSTYPHYTTLSPIPTLSHGFPSLFPEPYHVPMTPPHRPYAEPQAIPSLDDLGFGFPTLDGSSFLPVVHPSPPYIPSHEELWGQCLQPDPLRPNTPPFHPVRGATPPEIPLPAPVASSSGPQRTRQPARAARRHDPTKPARKKAGSNKDGWNQALVRFRAKFDTLRGVHNGQPSRGLVPAMALTELTNHAKEDLKRSPLRDTKAGEGKRSRDVEDYLKGLLKAIRPVEPTPTLAGVGSNEDNTAVASLSRLADELEARLSVVNQQPALRRSNAPMPEQKTGSKRMERHMKKNESEKAKRDSERHHLERISYLFRMVRQQWSKKDVLGLAVLFLLYGSEAFPHNFVEVRPIVPGL